MVTKLSEILRKQLREIIAGFQKSSSARTSGKAPGSNLTTMQDLTWRALYVPFPPSVNLCDEIKAACFPYPSKFYNDSAPHWVEVKPCRHTNLVNWVSSFLAPTEGRFRRARMVLSILNSAGRNNSYYASLFAQWLHAQHIQIFHSPGIHPLE